jgi:hypothetical protein
VVENGDVEGWHWTDYQRIPPPMKSYDEICPPAEPTATDIPPTPTIGITPTPTTGITPSLNLHIYIPMTIRNETSDLKRAALVIQDGDGFLFSKCVHFPEAWLTGLQLLQRSDLNIQTLHTPIGDAICGISLQGCSPENCFQCSSPYYWSYWRLSNGYWIYSEYGASHPSSIAQDGDVQGWHWTDSSRIPPPYRTFNQVCGTK